MTRATDLAWLAGFIDGDGSFRIHHVKSKKTGRGTMNPRLSFTQKDPQVLDKVITIVGKGKIHGPYHRGSYSHYQLIITGVAVLELAKGLYPYLGQVKRNQVDHMIAEHKKFYA